jgi:hypothetical protein
VARTHRRAAPVVARARQSEERVSLHAPAFEEVLAGLLKVDPERLDTEDAPDQASESS